MFLTASFKSRNEVSHPVAQMPSNLKGFITGSRAHSANGVWRLTWTLARTVTRSFQASLGTDGAAEEEAQSEPHVVTLRTILNVQLGQPFHFGQKLAIANLARVGNSAISECFFTNLRFGVDCVEDYRRGRT